MTSVNAVFRSVVDDLVEKRLWPVAVVLGIALIGIPLLLSKPAGKEPSVAPATAAPALATGGPLSAFQPVVNAEGKNVRYRTFYTEGYGEWQFPSPPPPRTERDLSTSQF